MDALHTRHCEACRAGAPRVEPVEATRLMQDIPAWRMIEQDGIEVLRREFDFPDFRTAFQFASLVAELAEQENHHPAILVEWGKVSVTWWTHKIKGLHMNDFIMAARTDLVARE